MATVYDVAAYICEKLGNNLTAMKLQKLIYYSLAWHSVWEDEALFANRIEAWANGPVSPELYVQHRGNYSVNATMVGGDSSILTSEQKSSIDGVIDYYNQYSSAQLSELTHSEDPWKKARERACADNGERCNEPISLDEIAEYYSSL